MKKVYSFLLVAFTTVSLNAQLTMLRQWHEPVAGDQSGVRVLDSTGTIPKNTGSAQTWDFSGMTLNPMAPTSSAFVPPSTVPASSMFAGATVVEAQNGNYTYFKSTSNPDLFEGLGYQSTLATVNYSTDAMTVFAWPISFGTSFTDTYAGGVTGMYSGAITGSVQTVASGEGTIMLPGNGGTFSNVLQLKSVQTGTISNNTATITNVGYSYFHTSQKFPLLSVNYFRLQSGTGSVFTCSVLANRLIVVGITDENFNESATLYPNPAHGEFSVRLNNSSNETCSVLIYDNKGGLVSDTQLETRNNVIEEKIHTRDLNPGIYLVKVQLGERSSTRKMIVE